MNRLRFIRIMRSKTLDDLSKETGIDVPRLSRLERGLTKLVKKEEKQAIVLALGIEERVVLPKED